MRFYTQQHRYTCGIDLHARSLYVCILDDTGQSIIHKKIKATPESLLKLIKPYQDDLISGVECMFSWYWVADFCAQHDIKFVLGHALYMKAIHGGKAKNDKIDSDKIARLLKGGMFPMAYVYPRPWRSTRDLMRRRMRLTHQRGELIAIYTIRSANTICRPIPTTCDTPNTGTRCAISFQIPVYNAVSISTWTASISMTNYWVNWSGI